MKNVMVYTSAAEKFDDDNAVMVKIQIENSLEFGWRVEDIVLVTNFDYEYMGVKSVIVPYIYVERNYQSNKVPVITYMMENDMIDENELYWYHDFDAYQVSPMIEDEIGMDGVDLGVTNYVYKNRINGGSFFFRYSAKDIFQLWTDTIYNGRFRLGLDEKVMTEMIRWQWIDDDRYRILDPRYNITMRDVGYCYGRAKKPVIVLHFHPYYTDQYLPCSLLDTFMYGNHHTIKKPLMSDNLIKIFNKYGIK